MKSVISPRLPSAGLLAVTNNSRPFSTGNSADSKVRKCPALLVIVVFEKNHSLGIATREHVVDGLVQ